MLFHSLDITLIRQMKIVNPCVLKNNLIFSLGASRFCSRTGTGLFAAIPHGFDYLDHILILKYIRTILLLYSGIQSRCGISTTIPFAGI